MVGESWSREEIELCVADYLRMLTLELSGQAYVKANHIRMLGPKLSGRSKGSIELKHANISAVLLGLGLPYIDGYKPMGHFQLLLAEVITEQLASNALFDRAAMNAVEQPAAAPVIGELRGILVDAPQVAIVQEPSPQYLPTFLAVRRDYFVREANNRSLGEAGELFVADYESRRLHAVGQHRLADRVEHVSKTRGDGLGYDVRSFEETGEEIYIEVKTTAFAKQTPFFVSCNEVAFSEHEAQRFQLYRLFEFRKQPKLFVLPGLITNNCMLDPITFRAHFGQA